MHILYVDESGIEDLSSGTSHFVLLGVAIPSEQWKSLDSALGDVKATYDLREAEIHTAWMHRRYSEQESVADFDALSRPRRRAATELAVRRRAGSVGILGSVKKVKAYRRESRAIAPYLHVTRAERCACLEELAREIASRRDVRIFADAISKPDFKTGHSTPYEMAFEQVLTRFQAYLEVSGSTGIVVHDNNDTAPPLSDSGDCTHLPGDSTHLPGDSTHLPVDSTHLPGDSLHTGEASPELEESLVGESELRTLAQRVVQTRKAPANVVRATILRLCTNRLLTRDQLGDLLHRNSLGLRDRYLSPMVREGLLQLKYPEATNRSDQAYMTVERDDA